MQKTLCLLALLGLVSPLYAAEQKLSITVSAGEFERRQTVVQFRLPPTYGFRDKLRDESGRESFLQVDSNGEAWFVIEKLDRGAQARFSVAGPPTDMKGQLVKARREQSQVKFHFLGKELLEYQAEPSALPRPDIEPVYQRGAYLHPVATLSGKVVTDHYPPNHLHQDGIFMAWTKTEFQGKQPDFWNIKDKKGRVEFVSLGTTWEGFVHGGFTSQHRHVDLTSGKPVVALNEKWLVLVYGVRSPTYWIFDLVSTQSCASTNALKLPTYHYGGFGYRGNWAWNGKDACTMLTSEGETDRLKGNGKPARWCDVWGRLDGAEAGIAVLGHPDNFRAPQPVRLHPTEPYISFAPQVAGPFEISPGKPYVSRFRFVVHDGKPDKAELDRLWNDYAHPPEVRLDR